MKLNQKMLTLKVKKKIDISTSATALVCLVFCDNCIN